ncbi:MAG: beta-ketoacyl-ACP synthase III [Planctomycetaceae bacterium]|nr:beta-ketoacyl-ACP synthase III [Planctomycetaceae bacterium]
MPEVYISGVSSFLPNDPVDNDNIENVLGRINGRSSKVKDWVLDYNGIRTRHYALDPATSLPNYTNAQMTAEAVRRLITAGGLSLDDIECLACGTSSADQIIPNHAAMVHGELGCPPCEIISTTGVCCSGMSSMKYAIMNVMGGFAGMSVATGSELASISFLASRFTPHIERQVSEFNQEPTLAFENDFLRWMLSDGAGAVLITPQPRANGPSLRVDWIELRSFANDSETCMYFGGIKTPDGKLESFRGVDDPTELVGRGYLSLAQDVRVLRTNLPRAVRETFVHCQSKHGLDDDEIDWILPHYSSEGFREPLQSGLKEVGFSLPDERWFTNLHTKGNTGSASIYIILDEFLTSGRAQPGDRILCFIPESARFTMCFMHLTVV